MKLLFSPFFYIVRCNKCGYGVYDRHIKPELLEEYYRTLYWQSEGLPIDKWHQKALYQNDKRAIEQYNFVKKWVEKFKKLNVLEVGSAAAYFPRLLKEKYPGEVHLNVVEAGIGWESYYEAIGISLIARFFPFKSNQKFEYIHASHWLEHVYNLEDTIIVIKSLLVKNGLLFVEVPNCDSDYYTLNIGDVPHIHFFTIKSLIILFKKHGFHSLAINSYGITFKEHLKMKANPRKLEEKIIQNTNLLKKSIPRQGGYHIRALFKYSN